ncbi:MAG: UDP-N-acetylglucosamine 2-epimerase (non-hydrolyzing), partial [Tepidisphaeraceae bacterium]
MRGLFVIGTRPEVIKMAPVVRAFRERNAGQAIVCMTGQHREMVSDAVEYFNIKPDLDLGLMVAGQSVGSLLGRC